MKQCPKCNFSCGDEEIICKNCGFLFSLDGSENVAPPQSNSSNPSDVPPQGNFNNPSDVPPQGNFNNPNGMPPEGNFNNPNGVPPQGNFNNPNGMPPQDGSNWQNSYNAAPNANNQEPKSNGMSIASLVLGIVGVVSFWCYGIGMIFGILSLIFGIISMKHIKKSQGAEKGHGIALAGIILSAVAIVISACVIVFFITLFITHGGEIASYVQNYMNSSQK